jgi:hypothetical protein
MENLSLIGGCAFISWGSLMRMLVLVIVAWMTPSFLFVGWRLWMSRPLPDVHYRNRWSYSHALVRTLRDQRIRFRDR